VDSVGGRGAIAIRMMTTLGSVVETIACPSGDQRSVGYEVTLRGLVLGQKQAGRSFG
jgi:hypothetical protein